MVADSSRDGDWKLNTSGCNKFWSDWNYAYSRFSMVTVLPKLYPIMLLISEQIKPQAICDRIEGFECAPERHSGSASRALL